MPTTASQKKALDQYYKELAAYHEKNVTHETAVRSAFQNLLATFAQAANWVLIPEQTLANGKRPDGTLRDTFNLPRGYWEAKDTKDDLLNEIRKKISAGYPVSNTIFEDTRKAILYQGNKYAYEADLTKPKELTDILDSFFHYAATTTNKYIVRLVGQVVTVSVETVKLVEKLAEGVKQEEWVKEQAEVL